MNLTTVPEHEPIAQSTRALLQESHANLPVEGILSVSIDYHPAADVYWFSISVDAGDRATVFEFNVKAETQGTKFPRVWSMSWSGENRTLMITTDDPSVNRTKSVAMVERSATIQAMLDEATDLVCSLGALAMQMH